MDTANTCWMWLLEADSVCPAAGRIPPLVPAPAVPIAEVVGCEKPGGPLDAEIDAEAEGGEKKKKADGRRVSAGSQ